MSLRETFKRFAGREARRKELAAKFNDDGVVFAQARPPVFSTLKTSRL